MTPSTADDRDGLHRPGAHTLLVADTDARQRVRVAEWIGRELTRGAKIYYKGWLRDGPRPHWVVESGGAFHGRNPVARGQLEFVDFPTVIERCGGTTEGLFRLQAQECRRAVDEGWTAVAMVQESAHRPMADRAEAAEFAEQERGYEELGARWPLRTLCQLTLDEENSSAAWEAAAVHHRDVSDARWSSTFYAGCLQLRGELRADSATTLSATVHGALREALDARRGPDLHVDLAAVESMDFSCAQILVINARSASRRQKIVVHRTEPGLRHLIIAAGRPRTLLFADELGA